MYVYTFFLCMYIHFFLYVSLYMQREIYFKELSSHIMIVGAGKSEIHGVNQLAGDSG